MMTHPSISRAREALERTAGIDDELAERRASYIDGDDWTPPISRAEPMRRRGWTDAEMISQIHSIIDAKLADFADIIGEITGEEDRKIIDMVAALRNENVVLKAQIAQLTTAADGNERPRFSLVRRIGEPR